MSAANKPPQPFDKLQKRLEQSVNAALQNQTQDVMEKVSERMTTAVALIAETMGELVEGLEARVRYLELPWYEKLGIWMHGRWNVFVLRWVVAPADPELTEG